MTTAKVFWTGRSQAIRLPKEFRFDTDSVSIRRLGRQVILEPVDDEWGWLDDIKGPVDRDFVEATQEEAQPQERLALDDLFP